MQIRVFKPGSREFVFQLPYDLDRLPTETMSSTERRYTTSDKVNEITITASQSLNCEIPPEVTVTIRNLLFDRSDTFRAYFRDLGNIIDLVMIDSGQRGGVKND